MHLSVTASGHAIFTGQTSHAVLRSEHTDLCAVRQAAAAGRRATTTRPQVRWRLWGVRRERGLPGMDTRPSQLWHFEADELQRSEQQVATLRLLAHL
jgi:hypothetical protein